jgi:hypothetical protein
MLDVLSRRAQIEEDLRNLVITRPADDTTTRYREAPTASNYTNNPQAVMKDTSQVTSPPVVTKPPVTNKPTIVDTTVSKPQPVSSAYAHQADAAHYVMIVLNKVDPVYVNEARNAFARHNRDTYYSKQMNAELVEVDTDNRLLLISPFKNAEEAVKYVDATRPVTGSQIVPWLKGGKYYYLIITEKNLDVLRNSKDIDKYKQFLDRNLPGKF